MNPAVYADSSFLVSLVCKDGNSAEACAFMAGVREALPFTPLHRIETRNALRNAAARGDITVQDCKAAFRQIEEDLSEGLLIHAPLSWTNLLRHADELSEKHANEEGQRTIDLLHVAAALDAKARIFLSFDNRQRRLAKAAGLAVKP